MINFDKLKYGIEYDCRNVFIKQEAYKRITNFIFEDSNSMKTTLFVERLGIFLDKH